jgi:hypothetical protein
MDQIVQLSITPVQTALQRLFHEAIDSYPVRSQPSPLGGENQAISQPKGWRQRRQEYSTKKWLSALFARTTKNHFIDEVESAHRLRCIYAWAEKSHQNNKIDSVLVEAAFGRKRYVELAPKISLEEFQEVQWEHFPHLDRVATEIVNSFRQDLWVAQGKGRQNRELALGCAAFLVVVSVIDFVIINL